MRKILLTVLLCSCSSHGADLEDVTEKVLKSKEGVDIQITPQKEKKSE